MNIWHIVSIICFALCLVMFFYFKWYIKKRITSSGSDERQTELIRLINEIDRITDRDSQLVEDRVKKLKVLLLDVDKRILLYEKDLENLALKEAAKAEENKKPETLYTSLGRGVRIALETPEIEPAIQLPLEPLPASEPVESRQKETPIKETPIKEKPPSRKQIRAHIDLLANEGLSSDEIASKLEISVAEVNLAMNLRRR